jgi:hypothetical protein
MLRDGVKAAPPAAHPIRIQRSCFRCHPDDHEFRLRVDVDELPVDAERNLNAAIAVDAIPLAAITAVREDLGEFGSRPRRRIAALMRGLTNNFETPTPK